ncbi:MAG: hypothetical protein HY209_05470 [Candidatus Omnitrophica bacterium]|nr:hypothetical protein [Candidatus Omnitrophota bacterium]
MKTRTDIVIHEHFKSAGVRVLDTKSRVSLGGYVVKDLDIDSYEVLVGDHGDVLLRPMAHVPASETWIYQNPKISQSIKQGLTQAKAGKVTHVKDVKKFLADL